MSFPIKMSFSTEIYGKVLCCSNPGTATSAQWWDDTLCATIKDADVWVYQIGLPDAFGAEFLYHSSYDKDLSNLVSDLTSEMSSDGYKKAWLHTALSSSNGWGHANNKCFTPNDGMYDSIYIEKE